MYKFTENGIRVNLPIEDFDHVHRIVPVTKAGVEVARPMKQSEVDAPVRLRAKVALPPTFGLDPVLRAQTSGQQRDR